jgi:RNA polymerase sigma-70 factor (ECF subfamily)
VYDDGTYSDQQLLRLIAEGNELAFRQLFNNYRSRLFTYLFKITDSREISEDALQEIFLKIWSRRETLPDIANINAYLYRMAHNYAYHSFRRMARESLVIDQLKQPDLDPDDPDARLLSKEIKTYIQTLVARLTPRQREIFLLSREHGLKHEEIASQLGLTRDTVKKHMVDALRFLREELGQNYGPQSIAILVVYQFNVG